MGPRAPDAVVFCIDTPGGDLAGLAAELGPVLDTVLVGGEWRVVGAVPAEDLEELGRMADAGDELRAESRLELLRRGRPLPGPLPRPLTLESIREVDAAIRHARGGSL